jgi:ABC-type histidine transport system ATPase subunit
MLLRISDVFLKTAKEGHTVIIIINEITYTRVLWNRMLFELKNAVVNSVYYVTSTPFAARLWLAERNVKK